MKIKFNKEISLSSDDVRDILIRHLHNDYNLSGIFDVKFAIRNKPIPGSDIHDTYDHWVFDGAEIRVSENET
jgi:hypothetical protein